MWPFTYDETKNLHFPVAVGEQFKYLGVDMICCRHFDFANESPAIVADYVTALGEIKSVSFLPVEWPALEAHIAATVEDGNETSS